MAIRDSSCAAMPIGKQGAFLLARCSKNLRSSSACGNPAGSLPYRLPWACRPGDGSVTGGSGAASGIDCWLWRISCAFHPMRWRSAIFGAVSAGSGFRFANPAQNLCIQHSAGHSEGAGGPVNSGSGMPAIDGIGSVGRSATWWPGTSGTSGASGVTQVPSVEAIVSSGSGNACSGAGARTGRAWRNSPVCRPHVRPVSLPALQACCVWNLPPGPWRRPALRPRACRRSCCQVPGRRLIPVRLRAPVAGVTHVPASGAAFAPRPYCAPEPGPGALAMALEGGLSGSCRNAPHCRVSLFLPGSPGADLATACAFASSAKRRSTSDSLLLFAGTVSGETGGTDSPRTMRKCCATAAVPLPRPQAGSGRQPMASL